MNVNKAQNQSNKVKSKLKDTRLDIPNHSRPKSRKLTKREAISIDYNLPKAFGWAPLETTSKQIMKLLKSKNLPLKPYSTPPLLQKRTSVARSEKYTKIRRQPFVEQGVEFETMLPLGYEAHEAKKEAREPPPVDNIGLESIMNNNDLNINDKIYNFQTNYADGEELDGDDYENDSDYEDFADLLKTHYSSKKKEKVKIDVPSTKPIVTHHHEQATIQRYPNMQRHRVRPNKAGNRGPSRPFRPSRKKRPPKILSPIIHQHLQHPANQKAPPRQPISNKKFQPPPLPPAAPSLNEPPKAEQQFQDEQSDLDNDSLLPTIYEPTSLQSILATHKIHTNVLRTRPRTQNVAYYSNGEDLPPLSINRQDGELISPYYYSKDGKWEEVYPKNNPMTLNNYQTKIQESKKEQEEEERRQYHVRQRIEQLQRQIEEERAKTEELLRAKELTKRIDNVDKEEKEIKNSGPITKSLAETAILALKLGEKVLNLYESVEPYVSNG